MTDVQVLIPEDHFALLEFRQDGLPGIAVVNTALREFPGRDVFAWHLSLMLKLEASLERGMPDQKERDLLDSFEDNLNVRVKGPDAERPNALFLARITWNSTRELIWRVFDAEQANAALEAIIDADTSPRPFDYRMEPDPEWAKAKWHLAHHQHLGHTSFVSADGSIRRRDGGRD
jgi:hypothetical protein